LQESTIVLQYSFREFKQSLMDPFQTVHNHYYPPDLPPDTLATAKDSGDSDRRRRVFRIVNVNDYQIAARMQLPRDIYEYLASGTDNEQTLSENRNAFLSYYLRPRVLRPMRHLSTRTIVPFFQPPPPLTLTRATSSSPSISISSSTGRCCMDFSFPVFVSPAGVHALCDPMEGECATAKACVRMGIPMAVSQHSTRSIAQIARAADAAVAIATTSSPPPQLWYQAYILKDRRITLALIEKAIQEYGYQGIFLTVDSVKFGAREADARNGFDALPAPHKLANYENILSFVPDAAAVPPPPTTTTTIASTTNTSSNSNNLPDASVDLADTYNARNHAAWDQNSEMLFDENVTWDDVRWLKQNTVCRYVPLIIKGIMTAEDAILAVNAGADGIMVSNHGGRQLDGCLSTIDVLPEIVAAVPKHVPVFMDGGIRRGTDILKALALGAAAVGIGKPVFFALAVGGQDAVEHTLGILKRELEAAMALTGCATIHDIDRSLVTRRPIWRSSL
jgi:isopentenyl diphosphate isomerase/L-lactate dehydrogenase-like FMN-dependent dehydrogenase